MSYTQKAKSWVQRINKEDSVATQLWEQQARKDISKRSDAGQSSAFELCDRSSSSPLLTAPPISAPEPYSLPDSPKLRVQQLENELAHERALAAQLESEMQALVSKPRLKVGKSAAFPTSSLPSSPRTRF